MTERSEVMLQRVGDMNTKFVSAVNSLTSAEFRIKRLEEEITHTKESYGLVHSFMSNYLDRRRWETETDLLLNSSTNINTNTYLERWQISNEIFNANAYIEKN